MGQRLYGRKVNTNPKHKWLAFTASFLLGGPFSAAAVFFIWKTSWNVQKKWITAIVATILINLFCVWIIAVLGKTLLTSTEGAKIIGMWNNLLRR